MLGDRPEPSAAFSALAITRSRPSRWRRPASDRVTIRSPGLPTISPINRIRMISARHFRKARLADHRDLDLAGIRELLFEGLGDVATDLRGARVVGVLGAGDDPQLAASLDRKCLLHARKAAGDRLQLFHAFDIAL